MKKLYILILLAVTTITTTAQTIGEAFYIYRNDGQINGFFRDEIDSIVYSHYDLDSIYYDENVTQLVYTPDSLYRIPLAAIDSVAFVQPETKYKEDAVPLTGSLFDYLISADHLTLTFDSSLPPGLRPRQGDKLVATDITSKLPCGFVGQVRQVATSSEGVIVQCDSIGLADAVTQFYGVYDIAVGDGGATRVHGPLKAPQSTTYPYDLPFGRKQLPPIDITAFLTERNLFNINYKNTLDIAFTPNIHIKVTRVIEDNPLLTVTNHTNLLVVTDADVEMDFDISGEASREWSQSFLPKQDFIIPPGIPFYFDIGVKASLSGEIATAFTVNSHVHQVTDITYYDVSLLPVIGDIVSPIVNRVDGTMNITTLDMNWDYLGFRAELKPCVYLRVGLSAISHVAGWVGGEFDGGVKLNGELMFDYRRLQNAEPGTAVYDELKDVAKIDVKPYVGAHFMAAIFDDRYSFRLGKPFENPRWTWYQGRILPGFSNTEAKYLSETAAQVKANVTNDCFIPYTVGFALYDEDNHLVETKLNGEKYWTRNAFPSYTCEFNGLDKSKNYKAYPVIRFFGKHDMLCSPSAELQRQEFPVEITSFKQTGSQYKKDGFTHNGKTYSYQFQCTVTVALKDNKDVEDWGWVYCDPDGQEAFISLKSFSSPYSDSRYVYLRNEAKSTATVYPYVHFRGKERQTGEPHDYPLEHKGETTCPDGNHPHWIDLGIGTQWCCCNVGASSPEEYGGYYTFDQAKAYNPPSLDQIKALVNKCSYTWTTQNGVKGGKFTGPNGGTIFLPAAGYVWDGQLNYVGSNGYYWSSSPYDEYYGYELYVNSGYALWHYGIGRYYGLSVRPVR